MMRVGTRTIDVESLITQRLMQSVFFPKTLFINARPCVRDVSRPA